MTRLTEEQLQEIEMAASLATAPAGIYVLRSSLLSILTELRELRIELEVANDLVAELQRDAERTQRKLIETEAKVEELKVVIENLTITAIETVWKKP